MFLVASAGCLPGCHSVSSLQQIMNNLHLLSSCKTGNTEAVKQCLEAGADVNCYDGWPLRRAVRHNQPEVWQLLLSPDLNINVNLVNQYGLSSLHTAARFGVTSAVQSLLSVPSLQPNLKTNTGATPLFVAVKYARLEVVDVLISDSRIDLNCIDLKNRCLVDVVGVSVPDCDETKRNTICDLIKVEENKRKLKQKKIEALRPEQILVRHAKEKLDKLINDLEEKQTSELLMFQENIDNDKKEFNVKQTEERDIFFSKIHDEEQQFFYSQEVQKNIFLSKMARKKYLFERMQEELREEYLTFEKQSFEEFREKQMEEKETLIFTQNSPHRKYSRSSRWSLSSFEIAQLMASKSEDLMSRSLEGVSLVSDNDKESSPCDNSEVSAVKDKTLRKHSCPPLFTGVNILSNSVSSSANISPVPSLELIPHAELVASIPATCPNIKALLTLKMLSAEESPEEEPDSPLLQATYLTYPLMSNFVLPTVGQSAKSTPRVSRKNTMEVVKEESDEDASVVNYNTVSGMVKVSSFNSNSSSSLESDFKLRRRSSSDSDISRTREGCWFP